MRNWLAAILLALVLPLVAAPGAQAAPPRPARPQLNRCPELEPLKEGQIGRTRPVPVARAFEPLVRASRDRLAVVTLAGATVCVDMRLKGEVGAMRLSPDSRFLAFDCAGYEAQGHVIVDRTGGGAVIDTGVAPVPSPSTRRFAAVHRSHGAFGELNGLGIWQIDPAGLRELARITALPDMLDWRIDGWTGEDCLSLSAVRPSRAAGGADLASAPRDRYVARAAGAAWRLTRAIGRGC